jgi:hypothetical protein
MESSDDPRTGSVVLENAKCLDSVGIRSPACFLLCPNLGIICTMARLPTPSAVPEDSLFRVCVCVKKRSIFVFAVLCFGHVTSHPNIIPSHFVCSFFVGQFHASQVPENGSNLFFRISESTHKPQLVGLHSLRLQNV